MHGYNASVYRKDGNEYNIRVKSNIKDVASLENFALYTAFLGIIALVGLVIKNGILLEDFINEERRHGLPVDEACITGINRRFNAIIISTLAVILTLGNHKRQFICSHGSGVDAWLNGSHLLNHDGCTGYL